MILAQSMLVVRLPSKPVATEFLSMGKDTNFKTHQIKSNLNVKVDGVAGEFAGEVIKGTCTPSGRGVLITDEGQVLISNFSNGKFAPGSSICIHPDAGVGGVFEIVRVR